MKAASIIFVLVVLSVLAGCNGNIADKKLLTVDFHEGHTLQYKFVSDRVTKIDWAPARSESNTNKSIVNKSSELMEMVVAYTPVEVNPYGLTTIKATCKSVKVTRSKGPSGRAGKKDAVESLVGKTFTFTVGPTGKMQDNSQLEQLIQEIGKKAFRQDEKQGRVKEPDMIEDFIATQYFLWDSVSSIEDPAEGITLGQTWRSKLPIPTSMVLRYARDVTYRLDEIRQSEKGQLAVIRSSYKHAESVPRNWPIPYSGKFQLSGPSGFLRTLSRSLNFLDLRGQGEELFNIDTGRIEQYNQNYKMQLEASLPLPGAKPVITINQTLKMQLIE